MCGRWRRWRVQIRLGAIFIYNVVVVFIGAAPAATTTTTATAVSTAATTIAAATAAGIATGRFLFIIIIITVLTERHAGFIATVAARLEKWLVVHQQREGLVNGRRIARRIATKKGVVHIGNEPTKSTGVTAHNEEHRHVSIAC